MELDRREYGSTCGEALQRVLKSMADLDSTMSGVVEESGPFFSSGMSVILGVNGKLKGRIVLDVTQLTAKELTKIINGEDDIDQELVLDTMAELGNIVAGHAITKINNACKGLSLMLAPPGVFMGDSLKIITPKLESCVVAVETALGCIKMSIGFERGTHYGR